MGSQTFFLGKESFLVKNLKCLILQDLLSTIDKAGDVQHYPLGIVDCEPCVPDDISIKRDLILSRDNDDNHASPWEIGCTTGILCSSLCHIPKNNISLRAFKR